MLVRSKDIEHDEVGDKQRARCQACRCHIQGALVQTVIMCLQTLPYGNPTVTELARGCKHVSRRVSDATKQSAYLVWLQFLVSIA